MNLLYPKVALIIFLFFSFESTAQLRFGLRVGANMPKIRLEENGYKMPISKLYTPQIGVVSELNITDMFFMQSGLHFFQRGGILSVPQQVGEAQNITTKLNNVHVPIDAGIRYYWKENTSIVGTIGIFGEYTFSGREKYDSQKRWMGIGNKSAELNPYTVGLATSGGLEFNNTIQVKLHYSYGFTRVYNLTNTKSNNSAISLTLAYLFGQ